MESAEDRIAALERRVSQLEEHQVRDLGTCRLVEVSPGTWGNPSDPDGLRRYWSPRPMQAEKVEKE